MTIQIDRGAQEATTGDKSKTMDTSIDQSTTLSAPENINEKEPADILIMDREQHP